MNRFLKRAFISSALALLFATPHFVQAADAVLATLNGQPITEAEVLEKSKTRMTKILSEMYDVKKDTIDSIIEDRLLDAEAKKQGVSSAELMKRITKDVVPPSDADAKAIYDMQKDRAFPGKTFDEVKEAIKKQLTSQKQRSAYGTYIDKLLSSAKVDLILERPSFNVSVDDDPSQGPATAPITLIEFSEFQCPFCKKTRPTVAQVLETYKGKIHYVFRDFPLSFHKEARGAAMAANCANEQGKYWEFNTQLFDNQASLGAETEKKIAQNLGLNMEKFNACVTSKKYDKEIDKDQSDGMAVGVTGTPAYFINGKFLSGAQPFANFKQIIDEELAKVKVK